MKDKFLKKLRKQKMEGLNKQKEEIFSQKKDFIGAVLSIAFSVFTFLPIAYCINNFYSPDIIKLLISVREISVVGAFLPEPTEKLLFFIGVIGFPVLIVAFTMFYSKFICKFDNTKINGIYFVSFLVSGFLLLCLVYRGLIGIASPEQTNLDFYFFSSFFYKHPISYSFFAFPLIALGIFAFIKHETNVNSFWYKMLKLFISTASAILLLVVFLMNIFDVNSVNNSGMFTSHFDSFFYSVSQVGAGKTLLVDFINLYGLYPHFLEPIFRIIGLNILNFTIAMAVLLSMSFLFIYLFLSKVIGNIILRFLGFTTIIFWGYIFAKLPKGDYYFQYTPLRFFFPCLLIYLAANYLGKKSKILYYTSFFVFSAAVLWNFDSGFIVLATWLLVLCYQELFHGDIKEILKKCILHVMRGVIIFLFVLGFYVLFACLRSSCFPDLSGILVYQNFFYNYGYYMLPMPLIHPWNIVILVYLIGLAFATRCVIGRNDEHRATIVALLVFLGVGLFSYYQGRSHNWNLVSVSYPAILLIVIFADDLLKKIKIYSWHLYHNYYFLLVILYFLSFSVFSLLDNSPAIAERVKWGLSPIFQNSSETSRNIDFIKKYTIPGEKIFILSGNEGIYYAESRTVSCLNIIDFREIFFKKEVMKLADFLNNNTSNKIFYDVNFSKIPEYYPLRGLMEIISKNYKVVNKSEDKTMLLLGRENKQYDRTQDGE